MIKISSIIIVLILLLLLANCATPISPETVSDYRNLGNGISRFIDVEAGVVCWTSQVYLGYSISCLPIKDTLLSLK
jgi:hypothetical protein